MTPVTRAITTIEVTTMRVIMDPPFLAIGWTLQAAGEQVQAGMKPLTCHDPLPPAPHPSRSLHRLTGSVKDRLALFVLEEA